MNDWEFMKADNLYLGYSFILKYLKICKTYKQYKTMKALLLLALVTSCVLALEVNHNQALPNGTRPNNPYPNNYNPYPNNNNNNVRPPTNNNNYYPNQQQQPQQPPSPCYASNNHLTPIVGGRPWQYTGPFKITCNLKTNPNVVFKYSLCSNANDCRTCIVDYGNCQGTVQIFKFNY